MEDMHTTRYVGRYVGLPCAFQVCHLLALAYVHHLGHFLKPFLWVIGLFGGFINSVI